MSSVYVNKESLWQNYKDFSRARVVSIFGVIHTLYNTQEGFLGVIPPISEAEIKNDLILIEDPKATIEIFEIKMN